ncbi:MAG: hypothetical protein KBT88_03075 [Gammaproteobacteria bacterium]|nr:hypothetical protein [Gammaproteobacteria bacterium]MBQ0838741.1 hypothetical protein [Gammaproteobacteria bacterium]
MNKKFWFAATPLGTLLRYSVAILSLLLIIELLYFSMLGGQDSGQVSASPSTFELLNPVKLAPQSTYEELVRRTLFSPDRKPKASVQQSTATASGRASENWLLAGVVITDDDSYAMFNEKQGQRHLKLEPEMLLDGWKVESISADRVVLIKNGESDTVRLLVSEPVKQSKRALRKQSRSAVRTRPGDTRNKTRTLQQKTRPRLAKPAEKTQAERL